MTGRVDHALARIMASIGIVADVNAVLPVLVKGPGRCFREGPVQVSRKIILS
ncbi:MAG TPA: hypothetical protein PLM53_20200 [Spirochaetota bacterium]|nr:hypothetical protein [Spirochaetota bacterium]HPC43106.1 hypothetical protein [Spirochaetota bacterium]HPL17210.1 hypothetical protein [Spirochaetota bacterium]HQF07145.1 hypothetical protein [Spirochaetota bacterium]HQH99417.1 hypothetical protein [Spirochaetota bacterium]